MPCLGASRQTQRAGGVEVIPHGAGRFVLTDDFAKAEVYDECWPFIGKGDEIRYRFGDHEVVLRRVTDNEVAVEITP